MSRLTPRRRRMSGPLAVVVAVTALVAIPTATPAQAAESTFVQVESSSKTASSVTVPLTATGTGNLLAVYAAWGANAGSATVTDSAGDAFSAVAAPTRWDNGTGYSQVFYAKNLKGGATSVTVAFPASSTVYVYAVEYSGLDRTDPLDVTVAAQGNSATPNSGSASTTHANDLLLGVGVDNSQPTAPGAGYTFRSTASDNIVQDRTVTATGSYDASATMSSAATWVMHLVAFKVDAATPQPSFIGDYETGTFTQWPICQNVIYNQPCSGYDGTHYSMRVQSAVKRQGSYAARFEVRDGDVPFCCGERAEVSGDRTLESYEGDERWYQWSTQFAPGFPTTQGWSAVAQWHSNTDGPPPLAFHSSDDGLTNGNFGLIERKYSNPSTILSTNLIWQRPENPGTWHDVKIHVKWSTSDSIGFIELWHNGIRQTFSGVCAGQSRCTIRTLTPGGGGAYYKQGYYRSPATVTTGVVYHDGFTMATTEAGLRPLS